MLRGVKVALKAVDGLGIRSIIDNRYIDTHFQPIVSIRKKMTIGIEALSRGWNTVTGEIVLPQTLFSQAARADLTVELDRLCRNTALDNYKQVLRQNPGLLLFLNLDTSIIDRGVVGSKHLINKVKQLDLDPENIVIEFIESRMNDTRSLKRFIDTYKGYGFMVALDDLGLGHSNLDRILHIKPDIIKLDRGLVKDIDQDYYKQEICKCIVNMARKIGALVIAEGVETMGEVITSMELGIDMLQGFYFAKPQKLTDVTLCCLKDEIGRAASVFKDMKAQKTFLEKRQCDFCFTAIEEVVNELRMINSNDFDMKLAELILEYPMFEYLYVLDMLGMQVTDSISGLTCAKTKNRMFQSDRRGTDQSLKEYCIHIQAGFERYTTDPYMSLATGDLCITNSVAFSNPDGAKFILCSDINPNLIKDGYVPLGTKS